MVELNGIGVLVAFALVFGLIGFLRGVAREVITSIGITAAYLIVKWGGSFLTRWTNMLFKMAIFTARGGLAADDPTVIWGQVSGIHPVIETDAERLIFNLVVSALLVILAYIVANKLTPSRAIPIRPICLGSLPPSRLLGSVAGLLNGYLVANYVIPHNLPTGITITLPSTRLALHFFVTGIAIAILALFGNAFLSLFLQLKKVPLSSPQLRWLDARRQTITLLASVLSIACLYLAFSLKFAFSGSFLLVLLLVAALAIIVWHWSIREPRQMRIDRGKSPWLRGATIQVDGVSITIRLAKEWSGCTFLRVIVISLSVLASCMTSVILIETPPQIAVNFIGVLAAWTGLAAFCVPYLRHFRESVKENTFFRSEVRWVTVVTLITALCGGACALGAYGTGIKVFNWVFFSIVLFAGGLTSLVSVYTLGGSADSWARQNME